MRRRGLGDDRGSVVAEFAVALPAVALVLLLGAGSLGACARQVRLQDAAADAARLIARGEPEARAWATIAAAVPGASGSADRSSDLVCVTASAAAAVLPFSLTASSCALDGGW
ncbi:TadE family type IV pilus minor pilin [uncultured Microbacterium sp.]|uniref:TadE family type IV pilus minor pilin n=1 Tax=uncultured Microbacterium sp. TaxID=191216 RepID=UPI0028D65602|nr:TadE family type IV pilus minor pilin [uncultured Microbacterium sp.]